MKRLISLLLAAIVIFSLFSHETMRVEAASQQQLPPFGGVNGFVWHPHGWGSGTAEFYLSTASVETIGNIADTAFSLTSATSSISTLFTTLKLNCEIHIPGSTNSLDIPGKLVAEVIKFLAKGATNEAFRQIDNANLLGYGVIVTLGASQLGRNSVGIRFQFTPRPDRPQFSTAHDGIPIFSITNDPNGATGIILDRGTVLTAVGARSCAFNIDGRFWLLDTGVWVHESALYFGVRRDINIGTTSYPNSGGSVSGGGDVHLGQRVNLRSWPAAGWEFIGWYEAGGRISEASSLVFNASENRTIQARFRDLRDLIIYTTVYPSGDVSGGGRVQFGTRVRLVASHPAERDARWEFIGWYENGVRVYDSVYYTFEARENRNLQARFVNTAVQTQVQPSPTPPVQAPPTTGATRTLVFRYDIFCETYTRFPFANYGDYYDIMIFIDNELFSARFDREMQAFVARDFPVGIHNVYIVFPLVSRHNIRYNVYSVLVSNHQSDIGFTMIGSMTGSKSNSHPHGWTGVITVQESDVIPVINIINYLP